MMAGVWARLLLLVAGWAAAGVIALLAGALLNVPKLPVYRRRDMDVALAVTMNFLGGAAAGWPLTARAQQAGKLPTAQAPPCDT